MSSRRTVVTGVGLVNPLGLNTAAVWDSLGAGKSGIGPIRAFDASRLPVRIAGEVPGFDAKSYIVKEQRKQIKVMARGIQLAVAAAQVAMDDGRVDRARLDPTRFGIEFGSGLLATELEELGPAAQVACSEPEPGASASRSPEPGASAPGAAPGGLRVSPGAYARGSGSGSGPARWVDMDRWGSEGLPLIQPLWMLKYLPNFLASHVAILHNAQGPNNSITESDVSGLLALGEAQRILERGQADFFLVGGAESKVNPLSMTRMCLFAPLSKRNDAPEQASRPFDLKRDGFVIGEGAGVLVVEDLEHARKRGARIYVEMTGFGAAFDRRRDGRGLARAVWAALAQAGVGPEDIDHVNANGLGTVETDIWEARGLVEIFGSRPVPVFAAKGHFGNLGAGSGTTELGLSILGVSHGTLPATRNCDEPDPACPVAVNRRPHAVVKPHFLKVGFNEMGQCAAVVCRRWEDQG
jgi:3-oxoacyl-[acyl-carrier-protein] synthase II